jgi:hypothetical protein
MLKDKFFKFWTIPIVNIVKGSNKLIKLADHNSEKKKKWWKKRIQKGTR